LLANKDDIKHHALFASRMAECHQCDEKERSTERDGADLDPEQMSALFDQQGEERKVQGQSNTTNNPLCEYWLRFLSAIDKSTPRQCSEFLSACTHKDYCNCYTKLQSRAEHARCLSFKIRGRDEFPASFLRSPLPIYLQQQWSLKVQELCTFFLDADSAVSRTDSTAFGKKMPKIALACVACPAKTVRTPSAFYQLLESRGIQNTKNLLKALERRKDEIEWDTETGLCDCLIAAPETYESAVNQTWDVLCAAVRRAPVRTATEVAAKPLPRTDAFPVYVRRRRDDQTDQISWFRCDYSGGSSMQPIHLVEVDDAEAVPDWLPRVAADASKDVKSSNLRLLIETEAAVGADPQIASSVYMFVMRDEFNVPRECSPQAYVGETDECTARRWFARDNSHMRMARAVVQASKTFGASMPTGALLVDLRIASLWCLLPSKESWLNSTRLYVLASHGQILDGVSSDKKVRMIKQLKNEEARWATRLNLVDPKVGMNKKVCRVVDT
jgi:hypothetical protein